MRSTETPSDLNRTLLGRMTPAERIAGRHLRSPDGHPDAPAAAAAGDAATDAPADPSAAGANPAGEAVTDGSAGEPSILADAASPGGDAAAGDEGSAEGAADEADAASGDAADAEVAPYEGLAAPEGYEALDTAALEAATPLMRQFGVPDDQAQAFIDGAAPIVAGMVERSLASAAEQAATARTALVNGWADEVRADPEIGGANYDRTVALSAKALDQFFPGEKGQEFRDMLRVTGLTNHPEMIRGFASIGAAISDGSIHIGDSTGKVELTTAQKLYDPAFQPPQQ